MLGGGGMFSLFCFCNRWKMDLYEVLQLFGEYRGGRGEGVLALVGGRWTLMKVCICKVSGVEGVLVL